ARRPRSPFAVPALRPRSVAPAHDPADGPGGVRRGPCGAHDVGGQHPRRARRARLRRHPRVPSPSVVLRPGGGRRDGHLPARHWAGLAGGVELIRRSAAEARAVGGAIAAGAGTDQLDETTLPGDRRRALATVLDAYREQLAVVVDAGAVPILMAS